eukprot:TRINITY_DN3403_c0_g1_i3.p1 TRINITY_DN3403_c0_g1~~TRINITY_DN3403_c0_g1_i3.p1  ORF type:complete len:337 (-),score=60.15 TRINITY_DN3403_c0_g1_i3:74-1084(-)
MGCVPSKKGDTAQDKHLEEKSESEPVEVPKKPEAPKQEVAPTPKTGNQETDEQRGRAPNSGGLATTPGDIEKYYELGKRIGSGSFSIVREAVEKKTGEKRAVKCIPKSLVENEKSMVNLRREITNLKNVNHANILKLFEVFEDEENFYLVMELVAGNELYDRIVAKGYYEEPAAANIIAQLIEAVQYLHSTGIAHRDLKPENILVTGEGKQETVKVADFGLSKNFGEAYMKTSCGSPAYVAPEVILCEGYDNSVDMWSVGVILYALLVGYPPFDAEDKSLFKKILEAEYDFDGPNWDLVSDEAKEFVTHLLVKNPKKRYTAQEALASSWITKHKYK